MTNYIRKAAERLPGRWYQGDYTDNRGNYCGLGHVMRAAGMKRDDVLNEEVPETKKGLNIKRQIEILNEVAREQYPDRMTLGYPNTSFPDFNDHPATTEVEAVAIMEKAAVKWDEQI